MQYVILLMGFYPPMESVDLLADRRVRASGGVISGQSRGGQEAWALMFKPMECIVVELGALKETGFAT